MSSFDQESISEREAFETGFWYFTRNLEILASPADVQCERVGNCNVAFELQYEVQGGGYLFNTRSSGRLTPEQRQGILNLVQSLDAIPQEVLASCTNAEGSILAMSQPCRGPIRKQTEALLALPAPAIEESRHYFAGERK